MATLSYSTFLSSLFYFTFPVSFLPFFPLHVSPFFSPFSIELVLSCNVSLSWQISCPILFPSSLSLPLSHSFFNTSLFLLSLPGIIYFSLFARRWFVHLVLPSIFPPKRHSWSDSAFSSFVNYAWLLIWIDDDDDILNPEDFFLILVVWIHFHFLIFLCRFIILSLLNLVHFFELLRFQSENVCTHFPPHMPPFGVSF